MLCCSTRASQTPEKDGTNLFGTDLVHAVPRFLVVLDHIVKLVAEELPVRAHDTAGGKVLLVSCSQSPSVCKPSRRTHLRMPMTMMETNEVDPIEVRNWWAQRHIDEKINISFF